MDTASCIGMSPLRTISMAMGMVVSTPGIPDGAASNSCSLSSTVCGAWSEPNMSMAPARNLERSSLRFSGPRTGGLTLYLASVWRSTSKVRWCMVTSVENPAALARSRPSGVVRWQMLMLLPLKWDASLLIAFSSASAGRLRRWSRVHFSTSWSMRWSSSAWTLTLFPVERALDTAGTSSSSSSRRMFPVVEPMNSLNPGTSGAREAALMLSVTAANSP